MTQSLSDDIVTRLRKRYCSHGNNYDGAYQPVEWSTTCERCELDRQAADEIERLRADRDRWFKLADGMADCLDSSTEAGDLLADYEKAVRDEQD